MRKVLKEILISFTVFVLISNLTIQPVYAQKKDPTKGTKKRELRLDELALPSDVNVGPGGRGSIFYSPTIKNKILIPVYIWGEVRKPGLHFVPIETSFIKGLSLAGGPSGNAKLDDIQLVRRQNIGEQNFYFNLEEGGDSVAHNFKLTPSDVIHVKRSNFFENRAYYTSLIGVVVTILSGILLYRTVRENP